MTLPIEEFRIRERAIIEQFFREKVPEALGSGNISEHASSEQSCIAFAKALLNTDDIAAVDNQGANSFTVMCSSRGIIVQFRLIPLKISIIEQVNRVYGELVPKVEYVTGFPLPAYTSKLISGRPHILQPFPENVFPLQREKRTVTDLGRFVASATWHEFPKSYGPSSSTSFARNTLDRLLKNDSLEAEAPELVKVMVGVRSQLHLLDKLPAVLTHNDFAQINILVADDGAVTGVVDFESASVEAFGTCIWGLYECFFGSMEDGKWSFFEMPAEGNTAGHGSVREVLEAAFWDSLWANTHPSLVRHEHEEAVKVALSVGVITRYFIRGMLDKIDTSQKVHQLSLEYARGILPRIWE